MRSLLLLALFLCGCSGDKPESPIAPKEPPLPPPVVAPRPPEIPSLEAEDLLVSSRKYRGERVKLTTWAELREFPETSALFLIHQGRVWAYGVFADDQLAAMREKFPVPETATTMRSRLRVTLLGTVGLEDAHGTLYVNDVTLAE